ncbi:MAG: chemotaxis protein CheC [Syntrophomonadaceae bacterium]|nr:chemotaxis protein CheC [Syntrophomonadaceae bacterium]
MKDFGELSGLQLDALREIGNIGAGNAATALAQMVNAKIEMTVPRVSILSLTDVPELLGGADSHVVGIYLRVQGSIGANILFVLPIDNARLLVDMLMAVPSGSTRDFGEIELSALQEVGNIVAATYLNAMVMFTQLKMVPSVPGLGIDMAGAILDAILAQFGEVGDYVLVLETKFRKDRQDVVGQFFLLPEPGSLDTILSALGVSN